MNGPNAEVFWKACEKELDTLTKMGVWEVVKKQCWMNVLPGAWAYKVKCYQDGLLVRGLADKISFGSSVFFGLVRRLCMFSIEDHRDRIDEKRLFYWRHFWPSSSSSSTPSPQYHHHHQNVLFVTTGWHL